MSKRIILCVAVFALIGAMPSYAGVVCSFKGQFDAVQKKVHVDVRFKDQSSITADLFKAEDGHFRFEGKLDHVQAPLFDISSVVESSMEILNDEATGEQYLRGNIVSKYSLINYKPASEVSGYFEIRNSRLYFKPLALSGITCDGYIGIVPPFEVGLNIALHDVDASDIPLLSGCPQSSSRLEGLVSGDVELSGFTDRLMVRGKLRSVEGIIEDADFESLTLSFDGLYPEIRIADSMITTRDGLSFNLEGNFDLTSQCDVAGGLTALKMSPVIDETDVHRDWTIKRRQDTQSSATEFKYRLQKPADDSSASKSETDMLSIGHSIKF